MLNQLSYIEKMEKIITEGKGFDWIIIVSSNLRQAKFWQDRLKYFKGQIVGKNAEIISQSEDWPGGAGQLLGTLYAWEKANKNRNLMEELKTGKKIAIYHTAGKGKRMAPLPAAERGLKPALKLPRLIKMGRKKLPMTLLEGIIFQTQIFAPTREGRLSVFWGDQIVIPAKNPNFEGEGHVEIFSIRKESPKTKTQWQRDWQHYGVLIPDGKRGILQREKISWEEFIKFRTSQVGKSLGFFSLSLPFLQALLKEFEKELTQKKGKLNTDFHLWMPLTCSKKEFLAKGGGLNHWERIEKFKARFLKSKPPLTFLSSPKEAGLLIKDKDLGQDSFWWDFGRLDLYHKNILKTLKATGEGRVLRKFFNLDRFWIKKKKEDKIEIQNSIIINSQIRGKIKNSLLVATKSDYLKINKALIINSFVPELWGNNIVLYNLNEPRPLFLKKEEVLVDVPVEKKIIRMKTRLSRNGKKDWEKKILRNPYSYQELDELLNQKETGEL